jgi:hypothetical protein
MEPSVKSINSIFLHPTEFRKNKWKMRYVLFAAANSNNPNVPIDI